MAKSKTLAERGKFKNDINAALFKDENIKELILGDMSGKTPKEVRQEFKKYVQSHLFIDDTISEARTFIFYDVVFPSLQEQIKSCQVIMYLISSRDILDNYSKDGYYGDRIDVLAQMVEDCLINDDETANKFGIGRLKIDSVNIYNSSRFYGCVMKFTVPNFR